MRELPLLSPDWTIMCKYNPWKRTVRKEGEREQCLILLSRTYDEVCSVFVKPLVQNSATGRDHQPRRVMSKVELSR